MDGTNLTGKAFGIRDNGTNDVAITEGSVTTNGISFVEPLKFDDNDIRIEYTGKVNGDEIQFHRQVGDFGSEDFTAKRIKTATVTSGMHTRNDCGHQFAARPAVALRRHAAGDVLLHLRDGRVLG